MPVEAIFIRLVLRVDAHVRDGKRPDAARYPSAIVTSGLRLALTGGRDSACYRWRRATLGAGVPS
jgi:hypothetical protein